MRIRIPNVVTTRVARTVLVGRKHSPAILFASGLVGVVATTVTACKATLQVEHVLVDIQKDVSTAQEVLRLRREDYTEADYKKDMAVIYIRGAVKLTKLYGPSVVLGIVSVAALTGSHKILVNRNAGMAAAYAAVEKGFSEYRDRVIREYGADKDREFRFGSETSTVTVEGKDGPTKKEVKNVSSGHPSMYARMFGDANQNWNPNPDYNIMFLRGVQNYANQRLQARGHVFLNEIYDDLGMDRSQAGSQVGWLKGYRDDYVDFGIFNDASMSRFHDFITGKEGAIMLDFNVDGTIWDKI